MVRRLIPVWPIALLLAAAMAFAWILSGGFAGRGLVLEGSGAHFGSAGVCYYTPGHELAPPTATEIAEARASWARLNASICRYDPAEGFGALSTAGATQARAGPANAPWPTHVCRYDPAQAFTLLPGAGELRETRIALARIGGAEGWIGTLWAIWGAIGTASIGHGLLVGSLSIFNPAFARIGWWLIAPEMALALIAWGSVAAAGFAGLGALPAYLRRGGARPSSTAASHGAARSWLTPKRLVAVGGGWLVTVGVLAAAYPQLSKYIPHIPGITAVDTTSAPRARAAAAQGDGAAATAGTTVSDAATSSETVPAFTLPPAPPGDQGGQGGASGGNTTDAGAPINAPTFSGFSAGGVRGGGSNGGGSSTGSGDGGATGGGSGGGGSAQPATVPALPSTTPTTSTYVPPASTPTKTTIPQFPAQTSDPTPALPAATPAPTEVPTESAAAPTPEVGLPPIPVVNREEARGGIATTPMVDDSNPLPSSPDAVLPVNDPLPLADDPTDDGGTTPVTTAPANPGAIEQTDGAAAAVPEPAMLGLFALGVGALAARRRKYR